eukprot:scaffold4902_cov115-Cylindrotheca_fusiformis.AAC.5
MRPPLKISSDNNNFFEVDNVEESTRSAPLEESECRRDGDDLETSSAKRRIKALGSLYQWAANEKSLAMDKIWKKDGDEGFIQEKAVELYAMLEQSRQEHFACGPMQEEREGSQQERDGADSVVLGKGTSEVQTPSKKHVPAFSANNGGKINGKSVAKSNEFGYFGDVVKNIDSEKDRLLETMKAARLKQVFQDSLVTFYGSNEPEQFGEVANSIDSEKGKLVETMKTVGLKEIVLDHLSLLDGSLLAFYGSNETEYFGDVANSIDSEKGKLEDTMKTVGVKEIFQDHLSLFDSSLATSYGSKEPEYFGDDAANSIGTEKGRLEDTIKAVGMNEILQDHFSLFSDFYSFNSTDAKEKKTEPHTTSGTKRNNASLSDADSGNCAKGEANNNDQKGHEHGSTAAESQVDETTGIEVSLQETETLIQAMFESVDAGVSLEERASAIMILLPVVETVTSFEQTSPKMGSLVGSRLNDEVPSPKDGVLVPFQPCKYDCFGKSQAERVFLMLASISLSYPGLIMKDGSGCSNSTDFRENQAEEPPTTSEIMTDNASLPNTCASGEVHDKSVFPEIQGDNTIGFEVSLEETATWIQATESVDVENSLEEGARAAMGSLPIVETVTSSEEMNPNSEVPTRSRLEDEVSSPKDSLLIRFPSFKLDGSGAGQAQNLFLMLIVSTSMSYYSGLVMKD